MHADIRVTVNVARCKRVARTVALYFAACAAAAVLWLLAFDYAFGSNGSADPCQAWYRAYKEAGIEDPRVILHTVGCNENGGDGTGGDGFIRAEDRCRRIAHLYAMLGYHSRAVIEATERHGCDWMEDGSYADLTQEPRPRPVFGGGSSGGSGPPP